MTFKAIKRALLLVALVALAGVSSFGALLAAPGAQAERQAMFGEVVSNDAGVLTLALKSGETTTVTVVDETELRVPDVEAPTSADIPVGARVALVAESREERLVVTKLQVIPSRVRQRHITLTVIDVVDNTVIAETENGAEVIVELEFEPTEDLVGQVVTFVGVQVDATRFRARSATSIRKIVERLENHATRNKERVEAAVEERGKQEARERLAEVKARLEETVKRQLDRFTEVLVKSPNQARPALERAMENITRSLRTALQKIDKPASEVDELVRRRAIAGTVESVDLEAGLVTIRTRGDAVVTVAVVDATRIVVGGEDGILDDLQDGDRVEIVFDSETNEAVGVHVRLVEEVKAKIESIDLNAGTVTLALRDGAVLTLNITDATQVRINRIQAARGDLESGMVLVVRYNRRTLDVVNIDAELRFEIEITVEEVDRENGIIRGRTADGRIIVQRLAPDANVEQGSVSASIRAIAPGTRVLVVVDKANDRALVVRTRDTNARTQHVTVRGRPTNVDTDGSTLTIERPDGGSVTVIVDTDTDMTIDGEPATLGDVTAETALSITFDAESKLALKVLGRTRVEPTDVVNVKPVTDADVADDEPATGVRTVGGTIVNGDADTNTLVIFTLNRRKVELHITSETLMSLNGEPVDSVHDLPRGAAVKAAFNAEDRTAIEVSAQKRDVDVRAVLKKETVKRAVEQVRRPTQNLAIQVKGVPTPGAEIRLIIYLNRQPVEGAQVTVNERDAGTTNADGALAFQVPADAEQLNVVAVFNDHKAGLRLKVVDRRQADLRQAVADRLKQAAAERRDEAQSTDRPTRAGLQVRVDGPVAPGGTVTIKIERDGEIVQGAEVKIGNRDVTVLASGELTFTVPADRAVLRALGIRLGTGRVLARIPVVVSFEGERAQGVITIVRPGADGAANIQRQDGQSQQATPQRTTTTQRQASTQTSSGN